MSLLQKLYARGPIWLQNAMVTSYGARIHLERYGRRFHERLSEFNALQWLTPAELEEYQTRKLVRLIRHAYEQVPYYRDVMDQRGLSPDRFRTLADLALLPVLTREDVKQNLHRLIARSYPAWKRFEGHTSGTTGSPLEVFWDRETCIVNTVACWRQKQWAGMNLGDRLALVLGRVVVPLSQSRPPYWRFNRMHHEMYLSAFHMRPENLRHYVVQLREFQPVALEAYPSTAYILARYLQSRAEVLPLTAVLTSSETLLPEQRSAIESAFACPVFDFYGMAERVVFAAECSEHTGHHLNLDFGVTEILAAQGEGAPRDSLGRLVATGLHNLAMPLLRYVTSDVSAIRSDTCPCGRGFPLLERVTTKAEDIVTTPDGRYVSSSVLTHPFKPLHNIQESQIVQEDRSHLVVKVVKGPHYSDHDTQALTRGLAERLGPEMKIEVEFVTSVPRTKAGKLRWVISKVPLEF